VNIEVNRVQISMTTTIPRAIKTGALVLAAVLLLGGCDGFSQSSYRIAGTETDFCVPRAVDVTLVMPTKEGIKYGGFAMRGCWNNSGVPKRECEGLDVLLSLSVSEKASFRPGRFRDFPRDAYIRETASNAKFRRSLLSDDVIAIPEDLDGSTWYVWRVHDPKQIDMADDDEFMATCRAWGVSSGQICNRRVAGRDYALSYSFFSREGLPSSFEPLDGRVVAEIEKLRCVAH
jgi:hypothetical protein